MEIPPEETADGGGPIQRLTAIASLATTLDRRVVELFESLEEIRGATAGLTRLSDEGADLVVDLRERLDRLEAKLRIDVDEIKNAVLSRLEGIDVERLGPRLKGLEQAVYNIEGAVTRLDRLVSGMVESVPDFITRRVKARASHPEEQSPLAE